MPGLAFFVVASGNKMFKLSVKGIKMAIIQPLSHSQSSV